MKKKVIAISCSDSHSANWKQFNDEGQRLKVYKKAWEEVIKLSLDYGVPILFSGDLNDHPKYMDNVVMDVQSKIMVTLRVAKRKIIGINGNHDFCTKSSYKNMALGYLHHLDRMGAPVQCIDYKFIDVGIGTLNKPESIRVHGIPYINGNIDFKEALENAKSHIKKGVNNILLIHTDLPGAVEPDGKEIGSCENISKYNVFKDFDLVLSGHIHKHQKLHKNVYMVGSMMQQRRSDAGTQMGYCLIYDDMSVEHVPLKLPEFKYYDFGTEKPKTDDFWIEKPAPILKINPDDLEATFDSRSDRKDLAKNYLKAKGIKSKKKLNLLTKYLNV